MPDQVGLGAREAIADLFYAYADNLDRGDIAGLGRLFTDQVHVDYGPHMEPLTSKADLVEALQRGQDELFSATSHHLSNVRVRLEDDGIGAQATAYVYAWHRYRSGAPDGELWGRYDVGVRLIDGDWCVMRLRLSCAGTRKLHSDHMHPIR